MSDPKTKPTGVNPVDFIQKSAPERMEDSLILLEMMEKITGEKPVMWGSSIIGFGKYRYVYASGRQGDWPLIGFSPRKTKFSVYVMDGFEKRPDQMEKLGKFKTGKGCLYINKLKDVDLKVLESILSESASYMKKKYPAE